MMKKSPKRKSTTQVSHQRETAYQLVGTVFSCPGILTKDLALSLSIDYYNNFNKRQTRLAKKVHQWIYRKRDGRQYRWYPREIYRGLSVSKFKRLVLHQISWIENPTADDIINMIGIIGG